MSPLGIVVMVIVIVLVVLGIVAGVVWVVTRKVRAKSEATIATTFDPAEVIRSDAMANYFGLASESGKQIRGNGPLVLTGSRIWFRRAGSPAPLDIPMASITGVDLVRAHAGRSVGRTILRVSFAEDSAAWYVREPEVWQAQILARRPELS